MNTNTAAALLASNPATARKAMDAINNMVEMGVAKDLGVDRRTARAALRLTGRA